PRAMASAETAALCDDGMPPVSSSRANAQRRSVSTTSRSLRTWATNVATTAATNGVLASTPCTLARPAPPDGSLDGVRDDHGDGHQTRPARHGRQPARHLGDVVMHVPRYPIVLAGETDVEDGSAGHGQARRHQADR